MGCSVHLMITHDIPSRRLFAIPFCMAIFTVIGFFVPVASEATRLSDQVVPALVRIVTDGGQGSGFVAEMNGKKYIVTNQHVIHGARRLSFKTVKNVALRPTAFSFSRSRDLARFELPPTLSEAVLVLSIAGSAPGMNSKVAVYGNSEGAGAFTELKGSLLGVGPDVVETDAEFVRGNSGSPIVNTAGEVVAVATYVTRSDPDDWVSKGTRFEKVRRYGVRLNCDDWMPCNFNAYLRTTYVQKDVQRYLWQLAEIIGGCLYEDRVEDATIAFIDKYDLNEERNWYHDKKWPREISNFCRSFKMEEQKLFPEKFGTSYSEKGKVNILRKLARRLTQMVRPAEEVIASRRWAGACLGGRAENLEQWAQTLKSAVKDTAFIRYVPQKKAPKPKQRIPPMWFE